MNYNVRYFERFEDYKSFFEDGISEEAIDRALRYAQLRGYGFIEQLLNDGYYNGMPPYLYKSYQNAIQQRRIFRNAGHFYTPGLDNIINNPYGR